MHLRLLLKGDYKIRAGKVRENSLELLVFASFSNLKSLEAR